MEWTLTKNGKRIIGIAMFVLFIVGSVLINTTVQALNQPSGYYGYYGGSYGYNSGTASSDSLPSAPTSLTINSVNLTTATISWTAPTTTINGTSLDNLNDYTVRTSTSSISDCTGGTDTGDTAVSNNLTGLTADTTYFVAVCANDTNKNQSAALTGSFDTAGALTSTNVQPATTIVGQTQTNTISFTTANTIPVDGKIKITYPSGFDVSGASSGTCSTMDGSFTTSVSGQIVTLTRSGGSSQSAAAETCTVSGIVNPTTVGSAGTYSIAITDSSDLNLDIDTSVSADSFAAASTSSSSGGGGGGGSTTSDDSDDSSDDSSDDDSSDTSDDSVAVEEGESNTSSYTVGTATSISVGSASHTITVSAATETEVTLTIESEPIEITVASGEYKDVDTDGDGIDDVRVQYDGLDDNGDPQLTITALEVVQECEMPSGTGISPVTGDTEDITAVEAGDFIKSDSYSTVYYVTADCGRRVFMDEQTYFTWQDDYDSLVNVTDATLSALSLDGIMLPKAGVVLVKIQSDPKVYALAAGSTYVPKLQWVTSEEVAKDLFGSDWADYVIDIEPTFFSKFGEGDDIEEAADYDGDTGKMKKRDDLSG